MSKDSAISELIFTTRSIFHKVAALSNMAIAAGEAGPEYASKGGAAQVSLEVGKMASELLQTRADLSAALQTRRQDLNSVVQVRTNFLAVQAIDDALRAAYSVQRAPEPSDGAFAADSIACHAYWLGQMKSNEHNSIRMTDDTYEAARAILDKCQRLKNSGVTLAPACDVKLSRLGCKVWENMLLQGLTLTHPFIAASAPHVLYKKRTMLDFSRHPMVKVLQGRPCTATQVESAKMLAVLVSHDVEHRIITPALESDIVRNFVLACSRVEKLDETRKAERFLLNIFDTPMHSLVASALGDSTGPDLSFLTDAKHMAPTTGYNMDEVSAFCLDSVLKL